MSQRKRTQSNTSRTVAIISVVVLVAVAIAGLVLAERRKNAQDSPTTPEDAAAMTAEPASAVPLPSGPNEVRFAVSSDALPADANDKLARIAGLARAKAKTVIIATQVEASTAQDPQMDLARRRGEAIHRMLEADGVIATTIRIQITLVRVGMVAPQHANLFQIDMQ
jgi:outer membrane protein OmpA-like peptidoglycan-associated protein